ncbi:MGMT family protein [Geotalea toluenoxydans]
MKSPNSYRHIYSIVSCIPKGRVATYGQIAQLAGIPGGARLVGYALSILADRSIPWHRVVNARGAISPRSGSVTAGDVQRLRLEAEGVQFDRQGRIVLSRYQWRQQHGARQIA